MMSIHFGKIVLSYILALSFSFIATQFIWLPHAPIVRPEVSLVMAKQPPVVQKLASVLSLLTIPFSIQDIQNIPDILERTLSDQPQQVQSPTSIPIEITQKEPPDQIITSEEEQDVVEYLNTFRRDVGLPPLFLDPSLTAAAQKHAADMYASNFCDTIGTDRSTPKDRVQNMGFSGNFLLETLGCRGTDAQQVATDWWSNTAYTSILRSVNAKRIGVGWHTDVYGTASVEGLLGD